MQIQLSAKNCELTPALREATEKKLSNLSKFNHDILKVEAQLERMEHHRKGDVFRFEAMVFLPKHVVRGELATESMQAAIDMVVPKLERQLKRDSEKTRTKDRSLLRRLGTVFSPLRRENNVVSATGPVVTRRKEQKVAVLSEAEAIERYVAEKLKFLVFREASSKKLMVLFAATDEKALTAVTLEEVV